jgi:hypothetical protein
MHIPYWLHLYYFLKPILPRNLQVGLRRFRARSILRHHADVWPIYKEASRKPREFSRWPDGKQFVFTLTHDVESSLGVENVLKLVELEKNLGFRSSFNFVPGDYTVPLELRHKLVESGFEVGIHGLYHNHRMYCSESAFKWHAQQINKYLKSWDCVGFRSPAMYHNLQWIQNLNILYDSSTFDTDPFEPQSDGMRTIFPFVVRSPDNSRAYVELPYTLAQDYTLYVIFKHKNPKIWKQKLDWIAQNEGMALLIVHPDYLNFGECTIRGDQFPIDYYVEFLKYVKEVYKGRYWHALPREVADYWMRNCLHM